MKNDEWLTPPDILDELGEFDLDPCSPINRPWDTARHHFNVTENGLRKDWDGRVWLNPPFGNQAVKWLRRMVEHGDGIALIPARTETNMFFECVWEKAHGVLFMRGRPYFHHVDGSRAKHNSGAPICLVAYGKNNLEILKKSRLGFVVEAK